MKNLKKGLLLVLAIGIIKNYDYVLAGESVNTNLKEQPKLVNMEILRDEILNPKDLIKEKILKDEEECPAFYYSDDAMKYIYKNLTNYNSLIKFKYKGETAKFEERLEKYSYLTGVCWCKGFYTVKPVDKTEGKVYYIFAKEYNTDNNDNENSRIAVNSIIEQWLLNNIHENMHDIEKIQAIHKYISSMGKLETSQSDMCGEYSRNTAESVILGNSGKCSAYADLFDRMARMVGIETFCIRGRYKGENHVWNMVKIDNTWLHLDMALDKLQKDIKGNEFKYFLVDDLTMLEEHIWDNENMRDLTNMYI